MNWRQENDQALQLSKATDWAIRHYSADHRFTAADVVLLHKQWLGNIYGWAGEYRQVNISKGGFVFAMAAQIPRLMNEFEQKILTKFTPCNFSDLEAS